MIIVLKPDASPEQAEELRCWIRCHGLEVQTTRGENQAVLVVIGEADRLDAAYIEDMEIVEYVRAITQPYKLAGHKAPNDSSVVNVGGVKIGGGTFTMIAGPCSVESTQQIIGIAREIKLAGAQLLRGGAFKPRTSPYSFQGMRADGLPPLIEAGRKCGMPIVSEITDKEQLPLFENVDMIQVGARNMQNFDLLRELGKLRKPILLKRGLASTLKELLMSAEYIMAGGNEQVILCERGIRTYDDYMRNTLDLAAVPMLKELTHLPVIVDPSHATGIARLVRPMALAAAACGSDGLIIEVHNDPIHALCDGAQSLRPEQYDDLAKAVRRVREAVAE